MRINGLSLASTEENVLCGVVYYFCYSHCTCLLLPSVGIKLLALVLSLGCKPFTGREYGLVRGTTKVPEKFRCLKAERCLGIGFREELRYLIPRGFIQEERHLMV